MSGTLKEQLDSIAPALREMQLKKEERVNQFRSVQGQIQKISAEIAGQSEGNDTPLDLRVNENDLTLKKLEEYQIELQRLHSEKVLLFFFFFWVIKIASFDQCVQSVISLNSLLQRMKGSREWKNI